MPESAVGFCINTKLSKSVGLVPVQKISRKRSSVKHLAPRGLSCHRWLHVRVSDYETRFCINTKDKDQQVYNEKAKILSKTAKNVASDVGADHAFDEEGLDSLCAEFLGSKSS